MLGIIARSAVHLAQRKFNCQLWCDAVDVFDAPDRSNHVVAFNVKVRVRIYWTLSSWQMCRRLPPGDVRARELMSESRQTCSAAALARDAPPEQQVAAVDDVYARPTEKNWLRREKLSQRLLLLDGHPSVRAAV